MHRCCVCETNENEKFETFSFFLVLNKKIKKFREEKNAYL